MKGRPKRIRKISGIPAVAGFVPYGHGRKEMQGESIFLLYEEYEALKLNDYEKYTQEESAAAMGVSRPTLTRIYMSAREKIATAFVEGRRIVVEGGKVVMDGNWFVCRDCGAVFSVPADGGEALCALCGGHHVSRCRIGDEE